MEHQLSSSILDRGKSLQFNKELNDSNEKSKEGSLEKSKSSSLSTSTVEINIEDNNPIEDLIKNVKKYVMKVSEQDIQQI